MRYNSELRAKGLHVAGVDRRIFVRSMPNLRTSYVRSMKFLTLVPEKTESSIREHKAIKWIY
jgi:hypothetical protein